MPISRADRRRELSEHLEAIGQQTFNLGFLLDEPDFSVSTAEGLLAENEDQEDADVFMSMGQTLQQVGTLLSDTSWHGRGPRGPYGQVARIQHYLELSMDWPDRDFRHIYRMSRPMFDRLTSILTEDNIFISTERVGKAIRKLRNRFICWPHAARKAIVQRAIEDKSGFANCIGSGDGSLIQIDAAPAVDGNLFRCRKKIIAVNIQATVDMVRHFTSFEMGWPGEPEVTAASAVDKRRMRTFNKKLSSIMATNPNTFRNSTFMRP
ncbi:hypothetical protein C8J56DRAFT_880792 [Mycena floridula]|nr:hypothetical protein C8J56DRAFT_880792 [Mycena floridula]